MNNITFYKIFHNDYQNLVYIGSTKNFNRRKIGHKTDCWNEKSINFNKKLYQFIRENNIDFNDLQWEILLEGECHIRFLIEDLFIQQYNSIEMGLNERKAFNTKQNYYTENKDKITEYNLNYYNDNKEKLLEQNKMYYNKNKGKIIEHNKNYYTENKDKILEYNQNYYIDNKNKILEQKQNYYNTNKDKILEKNRKKVKCNICNKLITKYYLKTHNKKLHK